MDCGCGAGEYIPEFLKFKGADVYGIEFSEEKVNKFKTRYPTYTKVIQGDIENMPFTNNEFDLIVLNEVLEHIPNQEKALDEIHRVLKPAGHLIVFSPNRIYPFESHGVFWKDTEKLISKAFPFIPYIPVSIGSKIFTYRARNYFPAELRNLLKQHKFKVKKHTYISQTFEGIGGVEFLRPVRDLFRGIFKAIEYIPVIRIPFCVSQVLVSVKKDD